MQELTLAETNSIFGGGFLSRSFVIGGSTFVGAMSGAFTLIVSTWIIWGSAMAAVPFGIAGLFAGAVAGLVVSSGLLTLDYIVSTQTATEGT